MASKKGGPASMTKSHRAYQPVLPCGNKLLQQKWDQTYYDDHMKLVKTAKPMVDSKAPPQRPHVVAKWKKQQLERERLEEIDRDNLTLLKKMQRIMKTEGDLDHKCASQQYRHSLNQEQRRRDMARISHENKQMLQRLQKVEPMYKVTNWTEDWQRKEELTTMITAYPEGQRPGTSSGAIPLANKIKQICKQKADEASASQNEGNESKDSIQVNDSEPSQPPQQPQQEGTTDTSS